MIPSPNFDDAKSTDPRLTKLADVAAQLGFEIVDIAGFLDRIDEQSTAQLRSLTEVRQSTVAMSNANSDVREALHSVVVATDDTLAKVNGSVTYVREAGQRSQTVAQWVKQLSERMQEVAKSLAAVEANNAEIAGIARQVNILAINAKIEAARAGDSGRGFGVVAEAINALSQKTAKAAEGIADNIETLSGWVGTLRDESATVSTDANEVITGSVETDHALNSIAEGVRKTHSEANRVTAAAESVKRALDAFRPAFEDIGGSVESTAAGIHQARERTNALVDASETIVQNTVSLGGASADDRFIDRVRRDAAKISKLFEQALQDGKITKANLMDRNYQPIPGSNPVQVLTGNTKLCDTLLPAILEEALQLDPRVVFCAAVDVNGYLPTHNKKFSQMQGSDVQWNTANCRNRRIFDDRVGLKAGRNKEKFLVQVYRRDMGGGKFTMMKDVSAPIIVNGQLWGGLRLAYTL